YTAVRLVERAFTDLREACVLLIGAGETIELAARHLTERQVRRLIVANRNVENARALAERFGGYAIPLADLPLHLAEADIVLSATASRAPVLTGVMRENAVQARWRRPMFLLGVAVPRELHVDAREFADVVLYTSFDL